MNACKIIAMIIALTCKRFKVNLKDLLQDYQRAHGGHVILAVKSPLGECTLSDIDKLEFHKYDSSWCGAGLLPKKLKDFAFQGSLFGGGLSKSDDKVTSDDKLISLSEPGKINGLFGDFRFLSNFHLGDIEFEGLVYPHVEAAYQAAKTLDLAQRIPFCSMGASDSRLAGQKLVLRSDWDLVRYDTMLSIVRRKFDDSDLKARLLDTGNLYIEETNWWKDRYWGVSGGVGQNNLGKILMRIRSE